MVMAKSLFRRKSDPLDSKARNLSEQIASLNAQIQELDQKQASEAPRYRSTAKPPGQHPQDGAGPIFEPMEVRNVVAGSEEEGSTAAHYNELGVRKYDVAAAFRRWMKHFRGPAANNPKLVSYLAAGSIHGLRPLRYEKRVARNRFVLLFLILLLILWGLAWMLFNR